MVANAPTRSVRALIRERLVDLVRSWRIILRLAVAPPLAWWFSMLVFEHNQAFFAPIAAVLTLTVGATQRVVVVIEIVVGAAFGILIGELLILGIGRGVWQLALIITLAVASARFVKLPGLAVTQAVISGVLLIAIVPAPGMDDPAMTRFVDALIGGLVALATIVLIPANPVREMDRGIQELLDELAAVLEETAQGLELRDAARASEALEQARSTQSMIDNVGSIADSVAEMARISPLRWGQREAVLRRTKALVELDHAVRNTRVLTRRAAAMLRHNEIAPPALIAALHRLAELARTDAENTTALVQVSHDAIAAATSELTINTAAIASQVRAIVADMLLAAGTAHDALDDLLDVD